jgi:WD40 repeat protein
MTHDFDDADARFAEKLAALDENLRLGGESVSTGETGDVDTRLKSAREVLQLLHAAFQGDARVDPPRAAQPAMRERVGRFIVEGILGEGAFGRVYRARDPVLGRAVALKVAKMRDREAVQSVKRFEREAKALAVLRHPNIVTLFDYGRDGDDFFIALALISGRTLQEEIARRKNDGTLDPRWAAETAAAVAEALAYAHASGIVHRDVKPGNVLIDEAGTPHLTDFGLAADREGLERLTHTGQMLGTPLYMSPEQIRGERGTVTAASDQYSLGIVLFELLTGRTPFTGPPEKVIVDHLETDAPSPRKFNASVPRDLATICSKCLRKEPAKRYAGCQELADDLRAWRRGDAIKARPMGVVERVVKEARRRPWTAGLAAGSICAVLGIVALIGQNIYQGWVHDGEVKRMEAQQRRLGYSVFLPEVERALKAHEYDRAKDLLQIAQNALKNDPPGFEWHILKEIAQKPIRYLKGHKSQTIAAAYSPDGKYLATTSVGPNSAIHVWDTSTWTSRQVHAVYDNSHPHTFPAVRFSPDSRILASFDDRGALRLTDLVTMAEIDENYVVPVGQVRCHIHFCERKGFGTTVAFCAGTRIEFWSVPKLAKKWDVPYDGYVHDFAISPDGELIAAASAGEPFVSLRDTVTKEVKRRFPTSGPPIGQLTFSHDGRKLAAAHIDHVRIWDVATGAESILLKDHLDMIRLVAFSPSDDEIFTMSHRQGYRSFDRWLVKERKHLAHFDDPINVSDTVREFDISPDGNWIAMPGRRDLTTSIIPRNWPPAGERIVAAHGKMCFSLAFTSDSKQVVTAGQDGAVKLWDAETGELICPVGSHSGEVFDLALSSDGTKLATCDSERNISLYDMAARKPLFTISDAHEQRISRILFSQDGSRLISIGRDGKCRTWDVGSRKCLHEQSGGSEIDALAQHPTENRVVAVATNGTVLVWNPMTTSPAVSFHDEQLAGTRRIEWSRDGNRMLAARPHKGIFRIDLDERNVDQWFDSSGPALAISPDGHNIVTGIDGKLTFFDALSRRMTVQLQLPGHDSQFVRAIAFSPDGCKLAAACMDGTLRLWQK